MVFKCVDGHVDMQGMGEYGWCADRYELFLAWCWAQTLWAEGPVSVAPVMIPQQGSVVDSSPAQ